MESTDRDIVAEEEAFAEQVRFAVRDEALKQDPNMSGVSEGLRQLRDEAIHAHERDLPSLFQQLYVHHSLARRDFAKTLPDLRAPYFGHLKLEENGQVRDILVGHVTFFAVDRNVKIIDWQKAPLAKVYFNYSEGESYEVTLPKGVSRGVVLARRILSFDMGRLVGVQTSEKSFLRATDGSWKIRESSTYQLGGGEGEATRKVQLGTGQTGIIGPNVSALLDKDQYKIIQEDLETSMLILGSAGSGKTTVALHRMAAVNRRDPQRFVEKKMLAIVPEPGLLRLTHKLLAGLNLAQVRLHTYDDWIERRARYLFKDLPKNVCEATPARVSRFKRHRALRSAFPMLVEHRKRRIQDVLAKNFPYLKGWESILHEDKGTLLSRIDAVERWILATSSKQDGDYGRQRVEQDVRQAFPKLRRSLSELDDERSSLYSNESMLQQIISASQGELDANMIQDVMRHSRQQSAEPVESSQTGHDLQTVDDQDMSSTELDIAGTIDVEDFSVLIELFRHYTGRLQTDRRPLHSSEFLLVDEAQELSELELQSLGQASTAQAPITVAGDAVQQIDRNGVFYSWERVLQAVGASDAESRHLETSYRCPRPIMEFAHHVLGPIAPKNKPHCPKDGAPVRFDTLSNEGHGVTTLLDEMLGLLRREPQASVALICPSFDSAKRLWDRLGEDPAFRLVSDGNFSFQPGVDICDVEEVKGLEFDYVIIFDASAKRYPLTPDSRRRLHVAATRAVHQLWVMSIGHASPTFADFADAST